MSLGLGRRGGGANPNAKLVTSFSWGGGGGGESG